jgi:hypothetical protein
MKILLFRYRGEFKGLSKPLIAVVTLENRVQGVPGKSLPAAAVVQLTELDLAFTHEEPHSLEGAQVVLCNEALFRFEMQWACCATVKIEEFSIASPRPPGTTSLNRYPVNICRQTTAKI